jgi:tetratricopeptide (TPR) repeat protein
MSTRKGIGFRYLAWLVLALPVTANAQIVIGGGTGARAMPLGEARINEKMIWRLMGRVTSLNGQPLSGVKVQLDLGKLARPIEPLVTNLKGEFQTELIRTEQESKTFSVKLTASKAGFQPAWQVLDLAPDRGSDEIELVLWEEGAGLDELRLDDLLSQMVPRLEMRAAEVPGPDSTRKDFLTATKELLDARRPETTGALLGKVVEREPNCAPCRTLLGLARVRAGSWGGATQQLAEAIKLGETGSPSPEPYVLLGVLESWRRQRERALGFFQKALEMDAAHPLALQEIGRVLVAERKWEVADEYLGRALQAGAGKDAHLLRARALLEMGSPEEADAEIQAYMEGRKVEDLPLPARTLLVQLKDRLELRNYRTVKSWINQPLKELTATLPELEGLEPAASQEPLPLILENAGKHVGAFFDQFPNTVSVEQVRAERLDTAGNVREALEQQYQYLLLVPREKWGIGLDEYRTDEHGQRTGPQGLKRGFMLTAGFACASLLFHPDHQSGSTYRYLGKQQLEGRPTFVVAFAQLPEKAKVMERFKANKLSALILLQGVAWIDRENFHILRMRTDLLKPQREVRLVRQTTEIRYNPFQFKELPTPLWLPHDVVVTVEWKGRTFRNAHSYSAFKLFKVETEEKRRAAEVTPKSPHQAN